MATFQFADSRLRAELVAAEPDVISPVAIAFDAAGRMFVAEMIDYPIGPEGGQIRCLEDRDGDGRFETATVFATHLPYPNGVLPWNGGVLVTAAPDILFVKDTDGDQRADERRVILTGFAAGNQQLRVNGLMWGLDNWVYGANGRSDGQVRGKSLRGHDFRFRPDTGEFETLAGRSQFGLARDDWGNRFLSWNTIPVRQEVIPEHYLLRHPGFSGAEGIADISEGHSAVFPLTPAPLTFNKESTSHFNALSGLTIYRGDALGPEYYGNAFVGESLRNLVHRRVLITNGVTFIARRMEEGKEFLASTDPWFHPVNFCTGPDGALYVVDFYRQFVEHPHYVPEKLRDSQPWRIGAEHGRVWRIVRKDHKPKRHKPGADLVDALKHSNGWQRDTAHRLLVERKPRAAIPALKTLLREREPIPALHALWILRELGALDPSEALKHDHPAIREHALRIAEPEVPDVKLDGNPRLTLQMILSLGQSQTFDRLNQLADQYGNERWYALALLSSAGKRPAPFVQKLSGWLRQSNTAPVTLPLSANPDREGVVKKFEPALKLDGDRRKGADLFAARCATCHATSVAPQLAGMSVRPKEALLVDVLDPSRAVAPDFAAYTIVLTDGEALSGLVVVENENSVTLRRPNEPDAVIPRARIRELKAEGKSLMPDGLEEGLRPQDLADLLAYLVQPTP